MWICKASTVLTSGHCVGATGDHWLRVPWKRRSLNRLSLPRVINFKLPPQLHQKYWHDTVKEPGFLHSLLRWRMITLPILTTSLIQFSLKGWDNVLLEFGSERVNWGVFYLCTESGHCRRHPNLLKQHSNKSHISGSIEMKTFWWFHNSCTEVIGALFHLPLRCFHFIQPRRQDYGLIRCVSSSSLQHPSCLAGECTIFLITSPKSLHSIVQPVARKYTSAICDTKS